MKTKSLNIRIEPRLFNRIERAANRLKWSLTTFVEESLLEKLIIEEELAAAKRK